MGRRQQQEGKKTHGEMGGITETKEYGGAHRYKTNEYFPAGKMDIQAGEWGQQLLHQSANEEISKREMIFLL